MPGSRRRRSPLSLVQQELDIRFYLHRLEEVGGGPVLVLGSANGRVAWELARHSPRVVAIEPSERMVAVAEAQRTDQPSEAAARLRFICADLRSVRLNETFPLVVAPQNAMGLLASRDDLDAFVASAGHHLSPQGVLAFDVLNPRPRPASAPAEPHLAEPPRPVFAPHFREASRGKSAGASGLRRWRLRLFSPSELDTALTAGGLVARERFGSFDGKVFEATDDLQVVVAAHD